MLKMQKNCVTRYAGDTIFCIGSKTQKQEIIEWLQQKQYWDLQELMTEIADRYQVVFASKQSYYEIFKAADISWTGV